MASTRKQVVAAMRARGLDVNENTLLVRKATAALDAANAEGFDNIRARIEARIEAARQRLANA